ncbi:DUF6973 domain-containing protein [Pedobacter sp. ASV12]|uniref:DUF6973 domain-containing protein n=1 Tax=Pedobacter sp. ASV12 TaxID=2795120 RepID=UPI003F8EC04A
MKPDDGFWKSMRSAIIKTKTDLATQIASVYLSNAEAQFVGRHVYKSFGVALLAKSAQNTSKDAKLGDNRPGGNQNAFRHVLGQALVTSVFGSDIAKEAGDAHEGRYGLQNVLENNKELVKDLKGKGSIEIDEKIADSFVDQLNNKVGRDIGIANPDLSNDELAIKSLEAVRDGKTYIFEKGKDGKAIVKSSHMSKDQFKKALQAKPRAINRSRAY